ncbi:MAG: DinB family protein [Acidobacteria bacterium]|nr:DinB family protein [Acidobacteriota bacterium]
MNLIEPMIAELQHEAATTKRLLERVPQESLAWQPHAKSMTLGRLSAHIANLPGMLVGVFDGDELDSNDLKSQSPPEADLSSILKTFDEKIAGALELLKTQPDERFLLASWRYVSGEKLIFEMPRLAVIRFVILNHLVHHRGQLSVYLRLLDVPLASVYGPTADEQLF